MSRDPALIVPLVIPMDVGHNPDLNTALQRAEGLETPWLVTANTAYGRSAGSNPVMIVPSSCSEGARLAAALTMLSPQHDAAVVVGLSGLSLEQGLRGLSKLIRSRAATPSLGFASPVGDQTLFSFQLREFVEAMHRCYPALAKLCKAANRGAREGCPVRRPDPDLLSLAPELTVASLVATCTGLLEPVASRPRNSSPPRAEPPRRKATALRASRPSGCLWRVPQVPPMPPSGASELRI